MSAKLFVAGLSVRLVGALMIWLGDGHTSILSKAVVIIGVALSIGGIAVLRFMLVKSFKVAHLDRRRARAAAIAVAQPPEVKPGETSTSAPPALRYKQG